MPIITKREAEELGIPRNKWFIHTILIPLEWTKKRAVNWLSRHGYRHSRHRVTTNYHRYNQAPEINRAEYTTKVTNDGVHLVFERY